MAKSLSIKVNKLEDVLSADMFAECELTKCDISDEALNWFERACERIQRHPLMQPQNINEEYPEGNATEIQVIFAAREGFEDFTSTPGALGLHHVTTPDIDIYCDETPFAKKHRVIVFWDREEILERISEPYADKQEITLSWLATLTHELQHVLLMVENANFNHPNDIDSLTDEVGRDLFDTLTGYGIRSLDIGGLVLEGNSAEHQAELLEEYVELRGIYVAADTFKGSLSPERFWEVAGLKEALTSSPP